LRGVLFFEDVINKRAVKIRQKERDKSHDHRGAAGVKAGRKDCRKQRPMFRNLELWVIPKLVKHFEIQTTNVTFVQAMKSCSDCIDL
jgi:hypothetical protein